MWSFKNGRNSKFFYYFLNFQHISQHNPLLFVRNNRLNSIVETLFSVSLVMTNEWLRDSSLGDKIATREIACAQVHLCCASAGRCIPEGPRQPAGARRTAIWRAVRRDSGQRWSAEDLRDISRQARLSRVFICVCLISRVSYITTHHQWMTTVNKPESTKLEYLVVLGLFRLFSLDNLLVNMLLSNISSTLYSFQ